MIRFALTYGVPVKHFVRTQVDDFGEGACGAASPSYVGKAQFCARWEKTKPPQARGGSFDGIDGIGTKPGGMYKGVTGAFRAEKSYTVVIVGSLFFQHQGHVANAYINQYASSLTECRQNCVERGLAPESRRCGEDCIWARDGMFYWLQVLHRNYPQTPADALNDAQYWQAPTDPIRDMSGGAFHALQSYRDRNFDPNEILVGGFLSATGLGAHTAYLMIPGVHASGWSLSGALDGSTLKETGQPWKFDHAVEGVKLSVLRAAFRIEDLHWYNNIIVVGDEAKLIDWMAPRPGSAGLRLDRAIGDFSGHTHTMNVTHFEEAGTFRTDDEEIRSIVESGLQLIGADLPAGDVDREWRSLYVQAVGQVEDAVTCAAEAVGPLMRLGAPAHGFEYKEGLLTWLRDEAKCVRVGAPKVKVSSDDASKILLTRLWEETGGFLERRLPGGERLYHALGFLTNESFRTNEQGESEDATVFGEYSRRYPPSLSDGGVAGRSWRFACDASEEYIRQTSSRLTSLFKSAAELSARMTADGDLL